MIPISLAQSSSLTGGTTVIAMIGIVIVIFLFLAIWSSRYMKVGPNQVLVISGQQLRYTGPDGTAHTRGFRIVKGGGTFVLPVIEKVDVLSLEPVNIEFQFADMLTSTGERLLIGGAALVKIGGDDISIAKAAEHFLNKGTEAIRACVLQVVEGHCRKTVSSSALGMGVKIEEHVSRDLAAMGLVLLTFMIRDLSSSGSIKAGTGKPPISLTT